MWPKKIKIEAGNWVYFPQYIDARGKYTKIMHRCVGRHFPDKKLHICYKADKIVRCAKCKAKAPQKLVTICELDNL